MKKIGLFAAGVLFGTAGIKLLAARMPRKSTPTPLLPHCVPRSV